MSDRLHSYLRTVIEQTEAVVVPAGWRVMVSTRKHCPVVVAPTNYPRTATDGGAVWLHMFYAVNADAPLWRLDSDAMEGYEKPDGLLWHQDWPSLQAAVDAVSESTERSDKRAQIAMLMVYVNDVRAAADERDDDVFSDIAHAIEILAELAER